MAMLLAALAAVTATAAFFGLRHPLEGVMRLPDRVLLYSRPYWALRGLAIPLQLWNSGMSGVLQGYARVSLIAAVSTGASPRSSGVSGLCSSPPCPQACSGARVCTPRRWLFRRLSS